MGPIAVARHLAAVPPGATCTCGRAATRRFTPCPAHRSDRRASCSFRTGTCRSWAGAGMTEATKYAILNANYIASRLRPYYPVLYTNARGAAPTSDLRPARLPRPRASRRRRGQAAHGLWVPRADGVLPGAGHARCGADRERTARRDWNRFCDAMIAIRQEIQDVVDGKADSKDNVLKNAPHTMAVASGDTWPHPYTSRPAGGLPAPVRQAEQVLAERGTDRQSLRRPPSGLCMPPDGGLRPGGASGLAPAGDGSGLAAVRVEQQSGGRPRAAAADHPVVDADNRPRSPSTCS